MHNCDSIMALLYADFSARVPHHETTLFKSYVCFSSPTFFSPIMEMEFLREKRGKNDEKRQRISWIANFSVLCVVFILPFNVDNKDNFNGNQCTLFFHSRLKMIRQTNEIEIFRCRCWFKMRNIFIIHKSFLWHASVRRRWFRERWSDKIEITSLNACVAPH